MIPTPTFWEKYAGVILGVGVTMGLQIIGGLIVAGMILQQIADLRENVKTLQTERTLQGASQVRSETRLDGIDVRLASIETIMRQLIQQKLSALP